MIISMLFNNCDSCYLLDCNVLEQLQQILILVQILRLFLDQHLFLYSLIVSSFPMIIIPVFILFLLWKQFCSDFIRVNLYRRIFSESFVFFDDIFKIILNVCNRIWSIRQIKFIIPIWGRNFKFIVVMCWFNVSPWVINT